MGGWVGGWVVDVPGGFAVLGAHFPKAVVAEFVGQAIVQGFGALFGRGGWVGGWVGVGWVGYRRSRPFERGAGLYGLGGWVVGWRKSRWVELFTYLWPHIKAGVAVEVLLIRHVIGINTCVVGVGGCVGGWVEWVEEKEAVEMSYWTVGVRWVGEGVGGWVGRGGDVPEPIRTGHKNLLISSEE